MVATTEIAFDRDSWARVYAQRHLDLDSGIVQVRYLPTNAPPREIRLLEVNKLISDMVPLEPINFGVGMDEIDRHSLYILDVTPSQWEAILKKSVSLPDGWTLDGSVELARV